VDVSESSGRDPVHDFEVVMEELRGFSEDLAAKPMIVAATKIDAAQDPKRIDALRKLARRRKLPFLKISSVTGEGLPALKRALAEAVLDKAVPDQATTGQPSAPPVSDENVTPD
jgi:GTP-binding protein